MPALHCPLQPSDTPQYLSLQSGTQPSDVPPDPPEPAVPLPPAASESNSRGGGRHDAMTTAIETSGSRKGRTFACVRV
jgi:hypothetical protein